MDHRRGIEMDEWMLGKVEGYGLPGNYGIPAHDYRIKETAEA
jgi:hypothetical protein